MIKQRACEFEPRAIEAVKSGLSAANEEISAHLNACADCRETARVVSFFQTNFTNEQPPKNLPAAGFLWWKSRIIEKRRRQERVAQPILIAQIAAALAVFSSVLWFLISNSAATDSLDAVLAQTFASIKIIVAPLVFGIIVFAAVCLLFSLFLRRYFLEK